MLGRRRKLGYLIN
uniref:Uncharacterized protein n=1 Tax=Anguilla anguilla TaxID=7936 RepID=A0A0E9TKR2_ANGAN